MNTLQNIDEAEELWDVFDINRQPTGKTHKRGEPFSEGEFHQVIHICIFNSKGNLLIQKRQPWKKEWSGMWDLSVAGSAIAGEDPRKAAERETLEELGLELDLSNIRPEFTINFDHGFDDYFIIQKDVDIRKLKLQKEEVAAVKWATKYEVHNLAAKHQMIPYILFDFIFDAIEHQNLLKKNIEKQEK